MFILQAHELKLKVIGEAHSEIIKFFPEFKMPKVEEYPSSQWLQDFKIRNEAKSDYGYALDVKRSENSTVGNISWWYDNVVTKVKWEEVDPNFIFQC